MPDYNYGIFNCLDSYRQKQISQSDDGITGNSNLKESSARYCIELWCFFRSTRGKWFLFYSVRTFTFLTVLIRFILLVGTMFQILS